MAGSTSSAGGTPPPPRTRPGAAAAAPTAVMENGEQKQQEQEQEQNAVVAVPLNTFTPAMFVEAEEDFALPPPPLPSDVPTRLRQTTAVVHAHAKAVHDNMWRMVVREKGRLHRELKQQLADLPPDQRKASERLSMATSEGLDAVLDNVQAPEYLFSTIPSSTSRSLEPGLSASEEAYRATLALQGEVEKFKYLREDDHNHHHQHYQHDPSRPPPSKFEVGPLTRYHLVPKNPAPGMTPPREYVRVRSLDVIQLAMQNLEGYAEQIPGMREAHRSEIARNLSGAPTAPAAPASTTATAAVSTARDDGAATAVEDGDPMDIDNE